LVVVAVLLFFSRFLQYLPHCILASIVFTIAVGLVNVKSLFSIRRESPGEFVLAVFTAAAVVLIGVEHGILVAVALSLLRHVRHSYRPHTMILAPGEDGMWVPVPAVPGLQTAPGLIVYRFGADLFYANDHFFVDDTRRLVDHAPDAVRWFVIDASAITDLDYSAARSVGELCENLKQGGIGVIFARVNQYLRADMDRHGITPIVDAGCIFSTLHEALRTAGIDKPHKHVKDAP
jgi:SulP family sulfate permease